MHSSSPSSLLPPGAPVLPWLALVVLTFLSLFLGEWFHGAAWLPLLVAAILWGKGTLVARHFIESHRAHPFIAWLLRAFILLTPLLLLLTAFFGRPVARFFSL
ncbi:hypothetical protein [Azospira sp.]|uniref:hypothetical protein n=1 Tax=Azospira sp. TaxID=1872671 RepID=UPI0025614EFE|nr:hypothetical protein [Azospira sp.]MDK9691187.1 hypothetical protein [Azospira sp.]